MAQPFFVYNDVDSHSGESGLQYQGMGWPPINYLSKECPYCRKSCDCVDDEVLAYGSDWVDQHLCFCMCCGYWSYLLLQDDPFHGDYFYTSKAKLKVFEGEIGSLSIPYLAKYLESNQEKVATLAPAKFEELVASILKEHFGYSLEFVSYGRPDKGIDVLFTEVETGRIGVQVKRYKNPIELSQIHEFTGAMIHNGIDAGIYVTSSRFRSGAYDTAAIMNKKLGLTINLVDGQRLFEFLNISPVKFNRSEIICDEWSKYGYFSRRYGGK